MLDEINSFQNNIVSFILEPHLKGTFLSIKIIFIIISIVMAGSIVALLLVSSWLKRFMLEDLVETFVKRPYGAKKGFKEWLKIQQRLESDKIDEYKLALIEADDLLDDVLQNMGYKGETMGDRLKQLDSAVLPNLEEVSEAHGIRNNVVHDPDYNLTPELAKRAVAVYEKSLRSLEVF